MQPRNYFTDAADWFLKRNPEPNLLSDIVILSGFFWLASRSKKL